MLIYFLMDYNNLASSIQDLTRSLTNWSSTVCIPTSESGKLLDISSAAKGKSSSTPLGATNQPTKYPTGEYKGSYYRFDPAIYHGQDSWEDLKRMLCKTGCVSGCKISTRHTRQGTSHPKRNLTPLLVGSSVPMNHRLPLPLHPVLLVRTM